MITEVSAIRDACDGPDGERPECDMLRALFDYGEVRQGSFDPTIEQGF